MEFLKALWAYITISAPYLVLGLGLSGLIKQFIPMDKVKKWLGGNDLSSVVKGSLVGVPLPLCSCSVIPTAVTLRKSGASKASTSSFLVSTPESGVDSMAVTYAMMDLPMTILRPLAAFFSALVAGVFQMFFNKEEALGEAPEKKTGCCSKKNKEAVSQEPLGAKLKNSARYAFGDLIDDIALWLLFGLVLGAAISVAVPDNFFQTMSPNQSRFLILMIGIPVYICASATTPIAASLILKGMSPGTALLLLLVGPATNASNVMVLQKYIGKKGVALNIAAVALVALAFSYMTDYLYANFFKAQWAISIAHDHEGSPLWRNTLGVFLSILIAKGVYKEKIGPWLSKKGSGSCCG